MKPYSQKTVISRGCLALCVALAASRCGAGTMTFANTGEITINDSSQPFRIVRATPYPSILNVSGFPPSDTIEKVTVTLHNLRHGWPDDIDILLVGPGGQNIIILSDAGGGLADPDVRITITLDDAAANEVPDEVPDEGLDEGSIASGTYRPANFDDGADIFPAPAPAHSAATNLSVFAGTNPNGDWRLYLVDDDVFDAGSIANGWSLTITTGELPPGSFAGWVASFGLTGAAAAAGADPDSDGLPNGAEYTLGGNPTVAATTGRPDASASGGSMIFTFPRDDASETPDVTLTVESGTDLVTWPTVFTIGADSASSSAGVSITENGTAPDTITVTIPQDTNQAKFARLKVTIAP